MGLFLWLKRTYSIDFITPLQGAAVAAVSSALLMSWVKTNFKEREEHDHRSTLVYRNGIGCYFYRAYARIQCRTNELFIW
jgi:hypothetical protein